MENSISRMVPPNSQEAEKSVLGAMMQSANAVGMANELLSAEDFYAPAHRAIFAAMHQMHVRGTPIDLVTLDEEMSNEGKLEGVGGTAYLMELSSFVPTTANVRSYITIVSEKATLRRLIEASGGITQMSYAQTDPVADVMNYAEKSIFDIVMRRGTEETLVHIQDVLGATYDKIEEMARLKGQVAGVPTGFYDLDDLLTGLHGGELIIVGARPAMGKTSFVMNIAQHACFAAGKTVAIFSMEMPREQIAMRLLCSESRVNMQKVRSGSLSDEDWMQMAQHLAPISRSGMYIDDTAALTPSQLRSRCRRLMMEKGLDLIILDYLQLMHPDKASDNRQQEVAEVSRQLKAIALELKVPVVACAQLARSSTRNSDKRPTLSDLRDSGQIEHDADVVMFLHRESYYKNGDDHDPVKDNEGEVIVAKQRNGPVDTVKLAWIADYATYANLSNRRPNM